jgi:hypothetical protein
MEREKAIEKIDNMVNVLAVEIPEEIEIEGEIYYLKKDISSDESDRMLVKYEELYEKLREKIREMDDVPDELVEKAIILRRVVLFLKEYRHSHEIEDKKRWIEFIKKMKS